MRLLNVIPSIDPARGGTAEGLRQSVLATGALGHVDEVVCLDAPDAPWLRDFPARVHALGPVASTYGYHAGLVPWLREHAGAFDAVVVHGVWQYTSLATWRALRRGPVPYFVYFHGMLDPWFKRAYPFKHLKKWLYWPWADYRVARDATAVLFTAREEARLAAQSFWLYRVKPAIVGYGLAGEGPVDDAQVADFHAAFPETRDRHLVLFLARLNPKKGCDLLVEAFGKLARDDARAHLVVAGPDPDGMGDTLRALAAKHGVADRITWTGMLQGRLKWGALRASDVFVLSSHQENFGVAVVEALSVGLPVLVSERVNIWREIVDDGAGFADDDTVHGTTAMLMRWHRLTPAERAAMRQRAIACYRGRFRMEAAAKRLVDTIAPHVKRA